MENPENHNMATNIRDLPSDPEQFGTQDLEDGSNHQPLNHSLQAVQRMQQQPVIQRIPPQQPMQQQPVIQKIPPQQPMAPYYQQQYLGNLPPSNSQNGYLEKLGVSGGVLKEIAIIVIIYVISNLAKTNSLLQDQLPYFLSDDAGIFINVFKGFLFAIIIIAIRKMLF